MRSILDHPEPELYVTLPWNGWSRHSSAPVFLIHLNKNLVAAFKSDDLFSIETKRAHQLTSAVGSLPHKPGADD